jgi:microcystin-dependent protein
MVQPFVGEIRMFGGSFNPAGWQFCAGQLLAISEYETLFNLIGTTYGGDGENTFALPNLNGRVPLHMGTGTGSTYQLGENAGVEQVTITSGTMAQHNHPVGATDQGSALSPVGALPAVVTSAQAGANLYAAGPATVAMNAAMIQNAGGSQPHENMQPYLCVSFIISMFGIFPSQT